MLQLNNKIRFFEELASNAHVALNVHQYDGWLMRFSNGYTRRANSISVIYPSTISLNEKIEYCEECYKKQGLPCLFKLTDDASDRELNTLLESREYEVVTSTDLLVLNLKKLDSWQPTNTDSQAVFLDTPTEEWLAAYFPFEGITDEWKKTTFRQMLSKVQVKTIYCAIMNEGKIVACASAAIEHGYMLLQNVVVDPAARGKGFGKIVCQSLIKKAKEEGADYSYLQVVQTNTVAYNLYSKLGFEKEYSYWYMRQKNV